jgi:hypothetical protein
MQVSEEKERRPKRADRTSRRASSPTNQRPRSPTSPQLQPPSTPMSPTRTMSTLDDLPPEILFEVLHYTTITYNRCPTPPHPLNAVASTSKHLHAIVEEHTRGLLKQHAHFTPPRNSKTFSCRKKWLAETCQFCRRKSQRRAILYRGITCCRLCDKQKYPKMVRFNPVPQPREWGLSEVRLQLTS